MNSLTLNGIETIGDLTDPSYRLGTGIDFGALLPDTATISSLLLDGDQNTGERTPNKTWNLTIVVMSTVDRPDLSAAIDALLLALNVKSFPVVWTPDGCPSGTVMTRGRPSVLSVEKNLLKNDQLAAQVSVTFQTGPFLASLGLQTLTVAPVGGAASAQLDGMNSGSFTNASLDTTTKYEGAGSAAVTMNQFNVGHSFYYRSAGYPIGAGRSITATDLSARASLGVRLQWNEPVFSQVLSDVTLALTLKSSSNGGNSTVVSLQSPTIPSRDASWYLFYFDLAAFVGSDLDLTAIDSYGISIFATRAVLGAATSLARLDDLRSYPPGSVGNSTPEGAVFNIPALIGSARTPVAIQAGRAGIPLTTVGVNSMTAQDSSLESAGVGSWGFTTNCTLAQGSVGKVGSHGLQLTATGAGNMSAFAQTPGSLRMPVIPNTDYTLLASSKAVATPRAFTVSVFWRDINDAILPGGGNAAATDSTSAFVTATVNVTSPPNAVSAVLAIAYTGCAASEVHNADCFGLLLGDSQTWVAGTGTYITAPLTFDNLLLHSPPVTQDPDLAIFDGLSVGAVTVPAANMNYDGTYSVVGFLTSSGAGARTVTVTITQKIGATTIATQTLTASITGAQEIVSLGEIALPLVKIPPESNNGSLVISIATAGGTGTDVWSDVALCDTQGQTILLTGLDAGTDGIWVDTPDPLVGIGPIYQSQTDRTGAYSAMQHALISGGPMLFEPANNKLLVASTQGAPTVAVSYAPLWLDEAQQ